MHKGNYQCHTAAYAALHTYHQLKYSSPNCPPKKNLTRATQKSLPFSGKWKFRRKAKSGEWAKIIIRLLVLRQKSNRTRKKNKRGDYI